ncbi:hypothetical protein A3D84_05430 [Candidatus Woesebacteria bacterium RIFCSPHIGHO2_02_FULL_42_20]|uniref:Uncharacterized protein n=1 Tax=Candidatus Woesebacteria bacterium RIFCSPHIGHO2_12_FULL_41_24 TaxID=1802510 RepID=A0A1F8APS7_9BACT|nr:MAG: hypothetical protein A3D84_05430 [Candidatus Woesebacteria bacterium RIFCSPHIGHO2_02_FULL_42_20]OGM53772.1 MAG: hypothetical protein A3E44_05125 [Candidatus Woesebacteria bacterium RIFCSPHIGHO2_12_FULL_41_24]OGM66304.1 MAG: hypothetical protein A2969_01780 [Candidatus Woesebacteria bacterium RIFCSPLOWO2_01_FULL_42_67]
MKTKVLLILILLLVTVLRFWQLGDYPALNADEASIGYDAYSLIQTGKDQHGNPWPISFQSFNDYKPGLLVYLVLPFVKTLGLNVWAVRVPGALAGVGTVLVLYLLVKQLKIGNWKLEIMAPALLVISPWHIHFSRGGWEVNVATFFITSGLLFFFKSLKNSKYLVVSCTLFVLSLYTYHAARIITPLLVFGLLGIYSKEIFKNKKSLVVSAVIGLFLLMPLIKETSGGSFFSRVQGVGIFADQGIISRIQEQRGEHENHVGLPSIILHNKIVNYSLAFLENWGKHFWGEFLFLSGDDIQRNRAPETGQLYLFQLIALVVGLWFMVKKLNKKFLVISYWLLVSPVAAALTFQSPHALRSQNMVIPLTIISAYGLLKFFDFIRYIFGKRILVLGVWCMVFGIVALESSRYLHMYWVHMAKEYPYSSQYGVKELVAYVKEISGKFDRIIVTDRYDQPYVLFLFYLKYPPEKFQNKHTLTSRDNFGFSTVREFANFKFESIKFNETRENYPNSLIIGTEEEIPEGVNVIKDIYGTNGFRYFRVVEN